MDMEQKKPKYGVFIIESMDFENELKYKLDGFALKTILDLCDIPNEYFYIRTKLELEYIIDRFKETDYGFLHIACHGSEDGSSLSLCYEDIDFDELDSMIGEYMKHRRLFLSACKVARFELAEHFIPKYHCYSVIGSPDDIDYDIAAIFWSSFYYLMYLNDKEQMFQVDILPTLLNITKTFQIKLNYFSIIRDDHPKSINHLREINIENGEKKGDAVRKTEFGNKFRDENYYFGIQRQNQDSGSS